MPDKAATSPCIFCHPLPTNSAYQLLLRSDNFILLADDNTSLGGGIILASQYCSPSVQAFANLSLDLLDEATFLRCMIAEFYREAYRQETGMYFEYGRVGTDLHPRLYCYPYSSQLWDAIDYVTENVDEFSCLPQITSGQPYLFISRSTIDPSAAPDSSQREQWFSRLIRLDPSLQLPTDYLHQILVKQVGSPHTNPSSLKREFEHWLGQTKKYAIAWGLDRRATLNFLDSVKLSNQVGNDAVAADFHRTWSGKLHYHAIGRFLSTLTIPTEQRQLRLLDVGCGPGHYLKVFATLGFDCVGIDVSPEMIHLASKNIHRSISEDADENLPRLEQISLTDMAFEQTRFDGIWYNAVMVHVPRRIIPATLSHMHALLADNGTLFVSALLGNGCEVRREGRVFFYYGEDELKRFFDHAQFDVVDYWLDSVERSSRGGQRTKKWIYFLLRKKKL